MPDTFHETSVAKSRKARQCSWCAESIEVGQPYRGYSWRDLGAVLRVEMHPECYAAMQDEAKEDGCWFVFCPGDYSRGCRCANGDCKCLT